MPRLPVRLPPLRLPDSLSWKLLATFVLVMLVAIGAGGIGITRVLQQREEARLVDRLQTQAVLLRYAILRDQVSPVDVPVLQWLVKLWAKDAKCRVTLVTGDGTVVADSEQTEAALSGMDNHAARPEVAAALQGYTGVSFRKSATLGQSMLYVGVPLDPQVPANGVIRLAVPLETVSDIQQDVARIVVSSLLAVLLMAAVLAAWMLMQVTRPLRRIVDTARRMAQGELHARAAVASKDEVGTLAETINSMAGQLERRVQELESQRNQARAVLDSMIEGVCALDQDGRVLWLNPSAQRLFGTPASGATGRRLAEIFRQPALETLVADVLSKRRPGMCEVRAFSPGEHVVRFQAAPVDGGVAGTALVVVAEDVTEMRRLEGVRREFVANVSHELKTPLTSIQGLIETLLGGALEDAQHNRRFLSMMDQDAGRLTRLIDDLLELSQVESKAVALHWQPVDVRALIQDLAGRLQPLLKERQVALEVQLPAELPYVKGDPERLRQVFLNLLENAAKFNKPQGRVTVSASSANALVRVAVEDTGIGIPAADLPRIFERFYRVDKARSRDTGGTGLGLSIVKHLVELHQGGIEVESEPGVGSRFTVSLPVWSALTAP